jgi:hypothetical protein
VGVQQVVHALVVTQILDRVPPVGVKLRIDRELCVRGVQKARTNVFYSHYLPQPLVIVVGAGADAPPEPASVHLVPGPKDDGNQLAVVVAAFVEKVDDLVERAVELLVLRLNAQSSRA